ncbi:MAG: DUF2783 domain-containing protein [Hyphomicrobiaceae bacterium]
MTLTTAPNIADPDSFYQELIDSQRDMTEEEAELMNAKLILILANQIGDRNVLREAIRAAGGRL